MAMIKIDGKDYDTEALSSDTRQRLQALQFVDAELIRMEAKVAVFKTARGTYLRSLKQSLETPQPHAPFVGDTIALG